MLEAAVKNAGDMRVLAVTVLTSLDDADLADIGAHRPGRRPGQAARGARACARAVTASSRRRMRSPRSARVVPREFLIVTPGVRPPGSAVGDQKRVMTPKQARDAGADLVVVGRPLRDAPDPAAAARADRRRARMSGPRRRWWRPRGGVATAAAHVAAARVARAVRGDDRGGAVHGGSAMTAAAVRRRRSIAAASAAVAAAVRVGGERDDSRPWRR